jgi:hypothetical protein
VAVLEPVPDRNQTEAALCTVAIGVNCLFNGKIPATLPLPE